MIVWELFAEGWPEDRYSVGLYSSEEGAVTALKGIYGPPYQVKWAETRTDDGALRLVGDFEKVVGYSTEHTAKYTVTGIEVQA